LQRRKIKQRLDEPQLNAAIEDFEPHFFNNMVLALDNHFIHKASAAENKDGNPLNEVRMLCNSMMNNNGKMCADKTIKYDPAKPVLKYGNEDGQTRGHGLPRWLGQGTRSACCTCQETVGCTS
jgi:hypothetical protein